MLTGFRASRRWVGSLRIRDNPKLATADGLSSLASVGRDLTVTDNQVLSECSCAFYTPLTTGGVGGTVTIENNASGCNSQSEIEAKGSCTTVAIEPESTLPTEFALHQNYPNPFNPTTRIEYSLPESALVTLTVFDGLGRTVAELVGGSQPAGHHSAVWNPDELGSGVYFYRLVAGDFAETKSMFLAK